MSSVVSPPSFEYCVPQASGGWVTDQHTLDTHHRSAVKHNASLGTLIARHTDVSMHRPTTHRTGVVSLEHDAAAVSSMAQCPTAYATRPLADVWSVYVLCKGVLPYLEHHPFGGVENGFLRNAKHREGRFIHIPKAASMPSLLAPCVGPRVQRLQRTCAAASRAR